ncbi:iron-sulfur cluster assembly accessory protein [Microvirga tunisiensis]|uniref:Iron-sulfur cluster assembly accessory protein n=2 Tax=Pannonibacter tanglangensis TaxID=2750084 RepID=A0ABW9ZBN6_9HYPH|nr:MULTISPECIES: iron-sulfur cluster assembly accessory protein [unclassified Pannonibacter]NBN62232.1 iron-sulfur cluster assembly accessory protein [Pannonibacter sp. XCT-34]NBN77898.1 iron-sulfur cluster assembly accessory protein [Pannonibacter sp. XCT-53]
MSAATDDSTLATPVSLSLKAARRVAKILSGEAPGAMLRVSVEGGGCSGLQYKYDIVTEREPDDLVLQREGATVLVDAISLPYLDGAEIDFVDDLMGQSFQIRNPNAVSGCGCGTSFAI